MDYDKTEIPKSYNRGRDHGPAVLRQWMNAAAASAPVEGVRRILDLGCGTGRFSQGLANRFNAQVVGVDASKKMLDEAQSALNHAGVFYTCGQAENLPLPVNCVDVVFISMVFHHFTDPHSAALECRRVLRDGGRVLLRTGCRERIPMYPYVPFFPSSRAVLEVRLPSLAFQREVFEAAGLRTMSCKTIVQEIAPDYSTYAEKLSVKADSILATLDDAEFQTGLDAIREKGKAGDAQAVTEPIDLITFEKTTNRLQAWSMTAHWSLDVL